jgi:hypothetical protein
VKLSCQSAGKSKNREVAPWAANGRILLRTRFDSKKEAKAIWCQQIHALRKTTTFGSEKLTTAVTQDGLGCCGAFT